MFYRNPLLDTIEAVLDLDDDLLTDELALRLRYQTSLFPEEAFRIV